MNMIMNTTSVKVARKIREAEDIFSYELISTDGTSLPPFSPGAHIDVHIDDQVTRQYSLCNDSTESHRYIIAVLRDPKSRGGSVAMHERVNEGDLIRISVPRNHFPMVSAAKTLLFAGGIGITPILCRAERLAQIVADFEMHYCCRSSERTAFHDRIKASPYAGKVHFQFDAGPDAHKLKAADVLARPDHRTHLYVCGPTGFIDHVINTAKTLNWNSEQRHLEYFGAAPAETAGDTAFAVQISSTGTSYTVHADRTVVQVLAENGIDIPVSCEQGVCGTCITRVLSGTPDHRDMYFTDEERARNDQFTPCCSRSKSGTLVLDL
jgi:vanillate O-demethylase ferredoxin subunit